MRRLPPHGLRVKLSGLAGRLVTSPPAFFVAFVVDLAVWGLRTLTRRTPAP
ncbi:MAG TPA: hypothetical protein VFB39_00370 [Solirubrobacteraceae bacterium]|nr:hypothetical protein [Solirubrobacteraceae bacterium]